MMYEKPDACQQQRTDIIWVHHDAVFSGCTVPPTGHIIHYFDNGVCNLATVILARFKINISGHLNVFVMHTCRSIYFVIGGG